jgi:hypothetical protein
MMVSRVDYNISDNYGLTGTIYNSQNETIGLFEVDDMLRSFVNVHYDLYKNATGHKDCLRDYIEERLNFSNGVEVSRFKIYFDGLSYAVKLTLL